MRPARAPRATGLKVQSTQNSSMRSARASTRTVLPSCVFSSKSGPSTPPRAGTGMPEAFAHTSENGRSIKAPTG